MYIIVVGITYNFLAIIIPEICYITWSFLIKALQLLEGDYTILVPNSD